VITDASIPAGPPIRETTFWRRLRWLVWGGAAFLLLLPAIAMRFTAEVDWDAGDFAVMGIMLGSVCLAYELALRVARSHVYVVAAGIAVVNGFLITWSNLAVGIIGNENNPANLMFFGVLLVGLVGAAIARLRASGMARAMFVTAIAQASTSIAALVLDGAYIFVLTAFFVAMWLISALLFRRAAALQAGTVGGASAG
jgi:hypothetical protein